MSSDSKPIFIECMACGERREVALCATSGPNAVTAARDGKPVTR